MKLFLSFLLMPLLSLLFIAIAWVISKKNNLLKNKKFIYYVLFSAIILALPALLGFINYWFMPYIYIALQVLYLLLGWLNMWFMKSKMSEIGKQHYVFELLLICTVMFFGMAIFSVIFNLCNELQYGILASTCMLPFLFLSLYRQTYKAYINIPLEIYKVWTYSSTNSNQEKEKIDRNNLMVINVELLKSTLEKDLLRITATTSENIQFGNWFEIFLNDYNKKSPLNPIHYNDNQKPYSWIFYTKTSLFRRRKYIDPDLSFKENKITPYNVIIARRVKDSVTNEQIFITNR